MALTIEGTPATTLNTTSAASHTLNLPSGIQADEILVVMAFSDDTNRHWTNVDYTLLGANGPITFLWKTATGSEGASDTFNVNTGTTLMRGSVAFRCSGLDATNPFLATPNYAEGQNTSEDPFVLAANTITGVTAGNDLILAFAGADTSAARSITTLDADLTLIASTSENRFHTAWEENPGTGNSAYSTDMSDSRAWAWLLVEANVAAAAGTSTILQQHG